jgi:hypothetical protein
MCRKIASKALGWAVLLAVVVTFHRRAGAATDDPSQRACPAPEVPAAARDKRPPCPPQTLSQGDQCVLVGDLTLSAPLGLASYTHLNCQGHRILPATAGSGAPPSAVSSVPEVAVYVDRDVVGVKIQNCLIGGDDGDLANAFDFGIWVRDSKRGDGPRPRTKILANTVNARFVGIGLSRSDDVLVDANHINLMNPGSVGIHIGGDSDGNHLRKNTIRRMTTAVPTQRKPAPGFPPSGNATAMGILVSTARASAVNQSIIAGVLSQTPQIAGCLPLNEDNVIEGNTVDMNRDPVMPAGVVIQTGIVAMDFAMRTAVRGNAVDNAVRGLTLNTSANPATLARSLAGTCVGGSGAGRWCGSSADCFLPAPRYTDTVAGTCSGAAATAPSNDPVPHDTIFEDNVVSGSFEGASIQTGIGLVLRGNTFQDSETNGVSLGGHALSATTLVTRNIIDNQRTGLTLVHPTIPRFGEALPGEFHAVVTLNDITGSSVQAIATTSLGLPVGYLLPTELSANAQGNHWGRTCADDAGFREAGQVGADSPAELIVDSHPYGVSVATTPAGSLPPACSP